MEYNSNVESLLKEVDKLLTKDKQPELIYVKLSSAWFPRRNLDLPERLKNLFAMSPMVKPLWDDLDKSLVREIGIEEEEAEDDEEEDVEDKFSTIEGAVYKHKVEYVPKVVVAMTSWKKRIGNCVYVINCLLKNTHKPDIVFLSLSTEEFPNLLDDLPQDLVKLCMSNPNVKLNWVTGKNTKSMKKVYPILPYLEDEDMIVLCDDDFDIPENFI